MKIAVIGAGFTGLGIVWHLLNSPALSAEVTLFDHLGIAEGTSAIAAGLLHPFAGLHALLNWRGMEGYQATEELLGVSCKALGTAVTAKNRGILRLAITEEQKADYRRCAESYKNHVDWQSAEQCQALAPGVFSAPGLWIKKGKIVYPSLYLKGLWQACKEKGARFVQERIDSLETLSRFDCAIAATGAESLSLLECHSIPLKCVKGQLLEVAWPKELPPLRVALNSQVYIAMTPSNRSCLIGGTFEREAKEYGLDIETAKKLLLPKAEELYPPLKGALVLNGWSGWRASAPDHRPFIRELSPRKWLVAGMGSKGLLYHALFAKELVAIIQSLQ